MADRRRTSALMVIGALAVPAALWWVGMGVAHAAWWVVAGWAAVLAAGQLVQAPAPSGARFTLSAAVAAALPLVMTLPGTRVPDGGGVLAAIGLGLVGAWAVRLAFGERVADASTYVVRRVAGMVLLLVVYAYLQGLLQAAGWPQEGSQVATIGNLIALSVGGVAWFLGDTLLEALLGLGEEPGSLRYLWLLDLGDWMVALTLFATGALFGFAWPEVGWWALPVAALPYVFSHLAFIRYFDTRSTYRQTIRALSRIPEVAGLSTEGHADRVSELAVSIARELGMSPEEVTELEYAALLHDIGRITLNEPSILKAGFTDEDVARWGAEIVSEAAYLERVATLVREQHHPYRRPGEQRDPDLPMTSKVIRAASAFDHATQDLGFSELEALEVLHRGAAYDFDPEVVKALRRVVELLRDAGLSAGPVG